MKFDEWIKTLDSQRTLCGVIDDKDNVWDSPEIDDQGNKHWSIPFKMAFQEDKEQFIKHWAKIAGINEKTFADECIKDKAELFDDDWLDPK